jgi:hypothetical protein
MKLGKENRIAYGVYQVIGKSRTGNLRLMVSRHHLKERPQQHAVAEARLLQLGSR